MSRNIPPRANPANDEQVLDEMAIEPLPKIETNSDAILRDERLPTDLIGRAGATAEDLTTLFENTALQHLTDGFVGSGDEDGENISQNDGDDVPDTPEHPAGA